MPFIFNFSNKFNWKLPVAGTSAIDWPATFSKYDFESFAGKYLMIMAIDNLSHHLLHRNTMTESTHLLLHTSLSCYIKCFYYLFGFSYFTINIDFSFIYL